MPYFLYERDEVAMMLCLDSQNRVIQCIELSRGIVNTVNIDMRRVLETALKNRAVSVILAHNHPDGVAGYSREDDQTTRQIYLSLKTVGISLFDHLIFASGGRLLLSGLRSAGFVHLAVSGLLWKLKIVVFL